MPSTLPLWPANRQWLQRIPPHQQGHRLVAGEAISTAPQAITPGVACSSACAPASGAESTRSGRVWRRRRGSRSVLVIFLGRQHNSLNPAPGYNRPMAKRSSEARKLARDLQKELDEHAEANGVCLSWSVPEQATIELIQDQIDRKVELLSDYSAAQDEKARVKLSAEVRLLEGSIGRLLKLIDTQPKVKAAPVPVVESQESRRARQAAEARWGRRARSV